MAERSELEQQLYGILPAETAAGMIAYMEDARRNGFGQVSVGFKNGAADIIGMVVTRKLRGGDAASEMGEIAACLEIARRSGWGEVKISFKNGRPDSVSIEMTRKV